MLKNHEPEISSTQEKLGVPFGETGNCTALKQLETDNIVPVKVFFLQGSLMPVAVVSFLL